MQKAIMINKKDNVATTVQDLEKGERVEIESRDGPLKVKLKQKISLGHKFAVKEIEEGKNIIKYGKKIGEAREDISIGKHVHIHNVESTRGRGDLAP